MNVESRNAELRTKPWRHLSDTVLSDIALPKGFITDEERQCCHYIAKHCVSAGGQIVDAGACLGSSAYCFGSGLAMNAHRGASLIHSYDRFLLAENYVADMITQYFRPVNAGWGDDFFDIFLYQTGKYSAFIRPHRGDFMQERWNGEPIDILFIDLAKTSELNMHIMQEFFPSLAPGRSLVLHQDFYFCWLPYIHISMQYLSDKFEILDRFIPSATRLFLLKEPISTSEIAKIDQLTPQERLDLLDAFIDGEEGDQRAMARVIKMCQLWYDKDRKGYQEERDRLEREFGLREDTNWGNQRAVLDGLEFPA